MNLSENDKTWKVIVIIKDTIEKIISQIISKVKSFPIGIRLFCKFIYDKLNKDYGS